jgi:hypothetical protein
LLPDVWPMAKLVDLFKQEGFLTPSCLNKRLRKQMGRGSLS